VTNGPLLEFNSGVDNPPGTGHIRKNSARNHYVRRSFGNVHRTRKTLGKSGAHGLHGFLSV
jgi:hypothetical protein